MNVGEGEHFMPSFARQLKSELARRKISSKCCERAEIKAFLQMSGMVIINEGYFKISIQTETASVARRLFSLFKSWFGDAPEILLCQVKRLQEHNNYLLQVGQKQSVLRALETFGFLGYDKEGTAFCVRSQEGQPEDLAKQCCRRAFLRAAFMAKGSITNPEKDYHLEIAVPYESYALLVVRIMEMFQFETRYFQRKEDHVVYLKGGDAIGEFLRVISAPNALLEFENVRVMKGVRNKINRLVNCETANLTKTVFASQEQISNIKHIQNAIGLESIPASLQEIALLRLRFPESTLQELGNKAQPPLSKSTVNHRLRRLNTLARKIKG